MSKIFLDYGHGGSDPGAIGNGHREKDLAKDVGKLVKSELERLNVKVYETRKNDETVRLSKRTALSNRVGADVFVSLHLNSYKNATAQGLETYSFSGSANGRRLADYVQSELVKQKLYTKNRGLKTANFQVLRNTNAPAILVELAFISNKQDVKLLIDNKKAFAKAIAKGVLAYLKVSNNIKPAKPTTSKPKPTPSKPKPANKANLKVDGYVGPNTVKALQRHFGLVVDGEIWGQYKGNQATKAFNQKAVKYGKGGSPVVKALQKKIGVIADGVWGANTTRALQRYLGTPVDGEIWRPSGVIKELQRRLNNGTF